VKRVGLFVSCLIDQLYPHVGFKVADTLERLGFEVVVPENQTCCGQPAFNTGYPDEARTVLRGAFSEIRNARVEAVVVPSGSCASMLKVFSRELVGADPVSDQVFEFSDFVMRFGDAERLSAAVTGRIIYHDSCHQLRALGLGEAPRQLVRALGGGLELIEFTEPVCCGFGGTFSVKMPEISSAMAADKIKEIQDSGANCVVSTDMGCLMQIASGLKLAGSSIRALHIAELVGVS
jgi:L-lactate dehydrogenase complex protein LldE